MPYDRTWYGKLDRNTSAVGPAWHTGTPYRTPNSAGATLADASRAVGQGRRLRWATGLDLTTFDTRRCRTSAGGRGWPPGSDSHTADRCGSRRTLHTIKDE